MIARSSAQTRSTRIATRFAELKVTSRWCARVRVGRTGPARGNGWSRLPENGRGSLMELLHRRPAGCSPSEKYRFGPWTIISTGPSQERRVNNFSQPEELGFSIFFGLINVISRGTTTFPLTIGYQRESDWARK